MATTWVVETTAGPGVDFTSIQDAIDAASPGDTIEVGAGTYAETLNITTADISIVADPGAILEGPLLTQLGVPPGTSLNDFFEQNHPSYSQSTGVTVAADDVSITGLTIKGFATGLDLATSDGVALTGNTFTDNVTGLRKGTAQQVTNVTVNDNNFTQGIHGMTINAAADGSGSFDGVHDE